MTTEEELPPEPGTVAEEGAEIGIAEEPVPLPEGDADTDEDSEDDEDDSDAEDDDDEEVDESVEDDEGTESDLDEDESNDG